MEALHTYFEHGGYPVMFSILATLLISAVLVLETSLPSLGCLRSSQFRWIHGDGTENGHE